MTIPTGNEAKIKADLPNESHSDNSFLNQSSEFFRKLNILRYFSKQSKSSCFGSCNRTPNYNIGLNFWQKITRVNKSTNMRFANIVSDSRYNQDAVRCYYSPPEPGKKSHQVSVPECCAKAQASSPQYSHLPRPSHEDVTNKLNDANYDRSLWLENLEDAPTNSPVLPEDFSVRPKAALMSVMCQPDFEFAKCAADIGRIEGFRVVIITDSNYDATSIPRTKEQDENIEIVKVVGPIDRWIEDNGEISCDGTVSIQPCVRRGETPDLLRTSIYRSRVERYYSLNDTEKESLLLLSEDQLLRNYPKIDFPIQGRVDGTGSEMSKASFATLNNDNLRVNLSYSEGGNVLVGTLPNGDGYSLVGRDSIAVSNALLERDTGEPLTEANVIEAVAKDLGIEPKNCFPVEQPRDFHIDMSMCLLAPGVVVLNDAIQAVELQEVWARHDHSRERPSRFVKTKYKEWNSKKEILKENISKARKNAMETAEYESIVAGELKSAGFTVHRMAGRFKDLNNPNVELMNFLNGESGTSPEGNTFFITQGGDQRAEEYVASQLTQKHATGLDRLYFLDRKLTLNSLEVRGAFNCRVKWCGATSSLRNQANS